MVGQGSDGPMRVIGRLCQQVALFAPPVAIIMNLSGGITLGQMLVMAVAAISLFYVGRIIEGYG